MRLIGLLITAVTASSVFSARDIKCRWSKHLKTNPFVVQPVESEVGGRCYFDGGIERDCDLTFKCDPGIGTGTQAIPFFFQDDINGDGIQASCRNGEWTYKGRWSHLRELPQCIGSCKALTTDDMVNATFVTGPPKDTYRTKSGVYWLAGTILETACKKGFTFTNRAFDTNGKDKHECRVRDKNMPEWLDISSGVQNPAYGRPAVCMATCKPMDLSTLPSDIELSDPKKNPENDPNNYREIDGGKVMVFGSVYEFKCKNGKNFTDPRYKDSQKINCIGGEGGWYDAVTKSSNAKPTSCSAPGCPPLTSTNLVPHANSVYEPICKSNGGAMGDGCEVTIKCAKTDGTSSGLGFYMRGKPNGHKLFCKDAKWVDESGAEVKPDSGDRYGGECVAGCAKLNDVQKGKTEVTSQPDSSSRNDDMEFVNVGSKMETKCKDSYIRPGVSTQPGGTDSYQCTDNGWGNIDSSQTGNKHPANCVGACPVPPDSTGTKYNIKGQVTVKNGVKYLQEGGSAEAQCEDKFTQPKSQPSDSQKLTCSGGNNGWVDSGSNKTGQSVLVCVKDGAAGCPIVNTQTHPNTIVTTEGDCTPFEGMLPENCKIAVTCKPGFIPETSTSVSGNGSQILQCKAGHDGYQDSTNGQTNVTPLKCIAGCDLIKEMRTSNYIKTPQTTDIIKYGDKEYLRKDAVVSIKCKDGFEFVHADDYNSRNPELTYVCHGGDDKYIKPSTGEYNKVPGDGCGGVCEALVQSLPGTEVTPINTNAGVSFVKGGKRMVVGYQYQMKCRKGYEYPRSSAPAQKGYQKLACLGGTEGYKDLESNATNAKMIECILIEEPSCPNLSLSPNTQNTEWVTTGGNCTTVGTKIPLGCEVNLKCKEGFFRSATTSVSPPAVQPLKCVVNSNGEAEWVGGFDNNPANLLKCVFGCPEFDGLDEKIIIWESGAAIGDGSKRYYPDSAEVSIKCANGYVSKNRDGSATDQDQEIKFKCTGGIAGKPWRNLILGRYEDSPVNTCAKFCFGLGDKKPEGVILKQGPFEKETSGGRIVTEGSFYEFDCMPGYKIAAENRPNNNSQMLVCNGKTGLYQDESNGNSTASEPLRCTKIIGNGCTDVTMKGANITKKNCGEGGGFPNKCEVTIKCANGFIPKETTDYKNPMKELTCINGNDWKDSNGNIFNQSNIMRCVEACKFDESMINENSKVTRNLSVVIIGGETYIMPGTIVPVSCVGDSIIWVKDSKETMMDHEFVCRGGDISYQRTEDNQVNVMVGEGCVETCQPLKLNLSTTVQKLREPFLHFYKGNWFVATEDSYDFKCANNYIYAADSKPALAGVETVKCDGKTGKYVKAATGEDFVAPTECIRNPQLNDCPKIEQVGDAWEEADNGLCQIVDGKFYKTGCKVETWCAPRSKPVNPDYVYGRGRQILTCGSGGSGWKDQNGKVITDTLECEKGCVQPDRINATSVHDTKNYIKGDITATCFTYQNTTTSGGRESSYFCSLPVNSTGDNNCTNACLALAGIPPTVLVDNSKAPTRLEPDNTGYVFGHESYVLKCKEGYIYPRNSPNFKQGFQKLSCNPTTRQYDDIASNKKNAAIEACEEADGCEELPQGQNSAQPTLVSSCIKNNGWYNDKCKLKYSCMPGFRPTDNEYLYAGVQEVTCDEQKQQWLKPNGKDITKTLDCVKGCVPVDYQEVIRFLNKTDLAVKEMQIRDTDGKEHTCMATTLKEEIMRYIERFYNIPNTYFCPGPKNDSSVVNRFEEKTELCLNTCKALDDTKLNEGTVVVKKPALLTPYHNQKYTGAGNSYEFGCKDGYEPVSKNTVKQILKCQADGTYIDEATGATTKAPEYIKCKKVDGCTPPSPDHTYMAFGANCGAPVAGKYKANCEITISCKPNSYPDDKDLRKQPNQKLVCLQGHGIGYYWGDAQTGMADGALMNCKEGCLKLEDVYSVNTNSSEVTESFPAAGKTVSCKLATEYKYANLVEGTHGYFCDMTKENFESMGFVPTCTNACVLDKESTGMVLTSDDSSWKAVLGIAKASEAVKSLVIPVTYKATLKCSEASIPFSVRLICDANKKLLEEKTGQPAAGKYNKNCGF